MRRTPPRFTWLQFLVFTLIPLLLFVICGFYFDPFRNIEASIYESPVFVTSLEARKYLTILLPDEARNIQFAGYREWIAAEDLIRFEAPTDVCLKHAAMISTDMQLVPIITQDLALSTTQPFGSNFKDSSWFDLAKATNVVHGGGGSHKAEIWIDQDRVVFYYHYTD